MKLRTSVLACAFALLALPTLAAADDHAINNSGQSLELACGEGGKVAVNGSTNEITITGNCSKLAVNGSMNDIDVEAVDKIAINGSGNSVGWTRGWKLKAPKVAKRGRNNKVVQNK
jgi:hypothetical protein